MRKRVLIVGGGIAGMAAAWWLERDGAEVTVIERGRAFQPLGHYITLKSHGVHVIEAMGLRDACNTRELALRELQAFTASGRPLRRLDATLLARDVDGMIFFRRADLHSALYEAVRDRIALRFGTELQAFRAREDCVEVDLPTGTERFDLLLGADGVHSALRRQLFGPVGETALGGRYLALTVDYAHELQPGTVSLYLGRGQAVGLLPRTAAELSAIVYHPQLGRASSARDPASIRAFLLEAFAGFAPQVRRSFEALDERAYVFADDITMIQLPRIARGRVALLGDAAHCPTFMSGMGSSLALQGARSLAAAISDHGDDIAGAVVAYERAIGEVARGYQASARKARLIFLERNPLFVAGRDALIRLTPDWLVSSSARRFYHANASVEVAARELNEVGRAV